MLLNHFLILFSLQFPKNFPIILFLISCALWDRKVDEPLFNLFFSLFPKNCLIILFIISCALWDRKMVGAPLRASLRHSYRWESGALSPALSVICDFFLVSHGRQRRCLLPCLGFVWQKKHRKDYFCLSSHCNKYFWWKCCWTCQTSAQKQKQHYEREALARFIFPLLWFVRQEKTRQRLFL